MRSILAAAAVASSWPALAQVQDPRPGAAPPPTLNRTLAPPAPTGWSLTIGAAPVLCPVWQGSRDVALSLFPDLRLHYRDKIFASIPDGVGWNAVNRNGWKAGPLAKIRFGRDEERGGSPFLLAGGSDALLGMGDVGAAGELGGFVERRSGAWRGRVELRRGFGGHEGLVMDASIGRQARVGRALVTLGPRVTLASEDFIDTYFGIDPGQSQRTELRTYAPSGGLLSFGIGGSAIRPLTRRSAITLFTGLDQLGGEAGRSPLVRERGRRTQFTLGLGYGYRFNL